MHVPQTLKDEEQVMDAGLKDEEQVMDERLRQVKKQT